MSARTAELRFFTHVAAAWLSQFELVCYPDADDSAIGRLLSGKHDPQLRYNGPNGSYAIGQYLYGEWGTLAAKAYPEWGHPKCIIVRKDWKAKIFHSHGMARTTHVPVYVVDALTPGNIEAILSQKTLESFPPSGRLAPPNTARADIPPPPAGQLPLTWGDADSVIAPPGSLPGLALPEYCRSTFCNWLNYNLGRSGLAASGRYSDNVFFKKTRLIVGGHALAKFEHKYPKEPPQPIIIFVQRDWESAQAKKAAELKAALKALNLHNSIIEIKDISEHNIIAPRLCLETLKADRDNAEDDPARKAELSRQVDLYRQVMGL